jgi:hypothetical protein
LQVDRRLAQDAAASANISLLTKFVAAIVFAVAAAIGESVSHSRLASSPGS